MRSPVRAGVVAISLLVLVWNAGAVTVISTADSGPGSLRSAIAGASPGDTIDFAASLQGQTISLATELAAAENLTIMGPGAGLLTISGSHAARIFHVTAGALTVQGLTLTAGAASEPGGGAVLIEGATFTARDSTFSANSATSAVSDTVGGGAILNQGGVVTLERCRFDSNTLDTFYGDGGAVLSVGGPAPAVPATLTVRDSTFTMNDAAGGGAVGGAIANEGGPSAGGAGSATATITGSTFVDNAAPFGGGAIVSTTLSRPDQQATLEVGNSTFVGNSAPSAAAPIGGGAIAVAAQTNGGPAGTIVNATFVNNTSSYGGTLSLLLGDVTLMNALINGPFDPNGYYNCLGTPAVTSHNLSSDATCGAALNGAVQKLDPAGLRDNGGPTETVGLLPDSPAVDGGDDAACAGPLVAGVDQRGTTRPLGAHCDIGAFELVPTTTTTTTTTTTLPPGCQRFADFDSIICRLDTLVARLSDLPAAARKRKLVVPLTRARIRVARARAIGASGKASRVRSQLGKVLQFVHLFRARAASKTGTQVLGTSRDSVVAGADELLADVKTLRSQQ
jgi:hypothetical protein